MRVLNALLLPVAILSGAAAMAGAIAPPPGPPPPVHELIQELEGDYSDYTAQDDEDGPRFGFSMAMYGDTLAVGAPNARSFPAATPTGVVFVFRLKNGRWQLEQRLDHSFSNTRECGFSVALDAYNLFIGCPGAGNPSNNTGRLRMYTRATPSSTFEIIDTATFLGGNQDNQRCGESMAVIGAADSGSFPFAAFGCPGWNKGKGRVEIYFFCPPLFPCIAPWETGWNHVTTLSPPPGVPGEPRFGASLSFGRHGNDLLLAVGEPGFPSAGGSPNGLAEVFRMGDQVDDWSLEQSYEGALGSRLGYSIHLENERLIAGAPTRRNSNQIPLTHVGGFVVATRHCVPQPFPQPPVCSWGEAEEFVGEAIMVQPQNRLGHAVHILATGGFPRVIAGEPAWPVTDHEGRAHHYYRDDGEWVLNEVEPFYPGPLPVPAALGSSLAGDGGWLAIGAPGYVDPDDGARGRVLVYAYDNVFFSDRFED